MSSTKLIYTGDLFLQYVIMAEQCSCGAIVANAKCAFCGQETCIECTQPSPCSWCKRHCDAHHIKRDYIENFAVTAEKAREQMAKQQALYDAFKRPSTAVIYFSKTGSEKFVVPETIGL